MGRARDRVRAIVSRLGRRLGFDVIRRNYGSPLPDLDRVDPRIWSEPHALPGVAFDLEAQFRFLEQLLAPFVSHIHGPAGAASLSGFDFANRMYGPGDAEVLYAMLRHLRPATVVEVGSGNSTLLAIEALRRNASEGSRGRLVALDPSPRLPLPSASPLLEHRPVAIGEAPANLFEDLGSGDVLFVDSSHVTKLGSDVNRIVLDLLPSLSVGVHVHFHDVFLPWEYPRRLTAEEEKFWTEQYLLHAFLIGNRTYAVTLGLYALLRADRRRVEAVIPRLATGGAPGAFWIRKVAATGR
jgi:hypothetical protein